MPNNENINFHTSAQRWAETVFGTCELGDARRTRRAVDFAARLAANPEASPNEACAGDDAAAEACYRFLRNDDIDPSALAEGPFQRTAELCRTHDVVLAIQDTTDLTYSHAVSSQLGDLGTSRGIMIHSALAVDGQTGEPIGLLDMQRRVRADNRPGKRKRKKRPYEEKESYKWEISSQNIQKRLGSTTNIIEVSDREADIYEYLLACNKPGTERRYIVRAFQPRKLKSTGDTLRNHLLTQLALGTYEIEISQRGPSPGRFGRPDRPSRSARKATLEIRATSVTLLPPAKKRALGPLTTNVVYVSEPSEDDEAIEWLLLTSEDVSSFDSARCVAEYYEMRWLIEEFHKAWKSGCKIEGSRLQSPANLERLVVITAQVAVRLLQLRSLAHQTPDAPCDSVLREDEWICLYATTNPKEPIPDFPPTLRWAMKTIAKLGGWRDTKRTGNIGWHALWKGWYRFQERVVAWRVANDMSRRGSAEM